VRGTAACAREALRLLYREFENNGADVGYNGIVDASWDPVARCRTRRRLAARSRREDPQQPAARL